jgi:hypothetical protein
LKRDLVDTELDEDEDEQDEKQHKKKNAKRRKRGQVFLLYMKKEEQKQKQQEQTKSKNEPVARTMLAASQGKPVARTMLAASQGKYPLRIAYTLPHLKFPIEDEQMSQDKAYLTGLLDTGGCWCMMGKLEWYQELHKVCPQLFDNFFELSERKYENINIGGLKDGIWLTLRRQRSDDAN